MKKLDFDDFLQCITRFSVMNRDEVLQFCFQVYDEDDSGSIINLPALHLAFAKNLDCLN